MLLWPNSFNNSFSAIHSGLRAALDLRWEPLAARNPRAPLPGVASMFAVSPPGSMSLSDFHMDGCVTCRQVITVCGVRLRRHRSHRDDLILSLHALRMDALGKRIPNTVLMD